MIRGTLGEVGDKPGDPPRCAGWFGQPSKRSGTGRRTIPEVRDGSGTLKEIRDELGTLGEVRDRSGDTRVGLGRVSRPSGRSGTCRGTLEEDWDG